MTDSDLAGLRTWAEAHAPCGSVQAAQVITLLGERDACAAALAQQETLLAELARHLAARDELIHELTERVAAQSELLSKRAEAAPAPEVS